MWHAESAEFWEAQSDVNEDAGRFLRILRFLREIKNVHLQEIL